MDSRQDIERILDQAYAARQKQDIDAVIECFHPEGCFKMNGSDGPSADRVGQRSTMEGLFSTFELLDFHSHCRLIDPPQAVVHWRGKFRSRKTGEVADTDVLDLIEVRDGRIVTLTSFFDTALAGRML
jgi:ketosteroid isomerase-like protein